MPPLSVNPHLLPESSVIVSRSDIYTENEDFYVQQNHDIDPKLVNHLKELVSTVWDLSPDLQQERSKKRRKLCSSESTKEGEWIAFRLLSSSKPHHRISLRPKTPPPPVFITREPETEDNELQATIRAERAQITAVDGSSILSAAIRRFEKVETYKDDIHNVVAAGHDAR
ncbi:hypothetical protein J132_04435 [Termitomyces sp. J132]|nr:hypothetical protein J132_04435 [Termitomyces sp. J132]